MSKIADDLYDALLGYEDDPRPLDEIIDSALVGRTIKRSEIDRLRKEAAHAKFLEQTLEVLHINLARAENEAGTFRVISDFHKALWDQRGTKIEELKRTIRDSDVLAQSWFDQAMAGFDTISSLSEQALHLRIKIWSAEKELNDLKKEINAPPEFIEPPSALKPLDAVQYVNNIVEEAAAAVQKIVDDAQLGNNAAIIQDWTKGWKQHDLVSPAPPNITWTGPATIGQWEPLEKTLICEGDQKGLRWIGLGLSFGAVLGLAGLVYRLYFLATSHLH